MLIWGAAGIRYPKKFPVIRNGAIIHGYPSNSVDCLNLGGTCVGKSEAGRCNRGIKEGLCNNKGTSGGEQVCCLNCGTKG